jgi:hypothetical protein
MATQNAKRRRGRRRAKRRSGRAADMEVNNTRVGEKKKSCSGRREQFSSYFSVRQHVHNLVQQHNKRKKRKKMGSEGDEKKRRLSESACRPSKKHSSPPPPPFSPHAQRKKHKQGSSPHQGRKKETDVRDATCA